MSRVTGIDTLIVVLGVVVILVVALAILSMR